MAETRLSLTVTDLTAIQFFDYTSPSALTYSPNIETGEISWTEHFAEPVELQDQNGAALSHRNGPLTGRSEITLSNVTLFDVGRHTSDVTLWDILRQTGVVSSTWVSASGTGADGSRVIPALDEGERKRFGFKITAANRGASGAVKGGTWTWDDVDVAPGYQISWVRGGCRIQSLTLRSSQMAPFMARTT